MPSLDLSGKKKEKSSEMTIEKTLEFDSPKEMKIKKEKKSKSKKQASDSETEKVHSNGVEKKIKKEKKRKAAEVDDDGGGEGEGSQTSLELGEPINMTNSEGKKGNKKAKVLDAAEDESADGELTKEEEHPYALSKFRLSERLKEALITNNITFLYDIQAMTFDNILDGNDLVGRAVTGTGKTLAFLLPILESLASQQQTKEYGRAPSVLVLLPTRELAIQVFKEFEVYGGALGKKSCCLYGQTPYREQEIQLKRGVDIVVGTPGRVKDLIERGCLDFSSLKFRVLDEADEMLKMGFVDDVELILGKVKDASKVQTLLFSATLPDWVKQISTKFLKPDKKTADLVGNKKMKASASVKHLVLPCSASEIPKLIPDIIRCYSSGGRTIIFTEKKESASELAGLLPGARALHGDIQQSQREVTLTGFRSGKFKILVATNVAARGLDIDDVQLIIQCEPPRQVEAYIHRSGRTGRAGNTGIAIMLFDPRKSNISKIERESGVKFEHISAPQSADIARFIGAEIAKKITEVSDSVVPAFKDVAEELLNNSNLSPAVLLAKAIAKAAGYSEIKSRSLLTSMENYVTLLLECGRPVYTPSFAYGVLRRFLPEDKVESIQGLSLTADGNGAVFDVTSEYLDMFLAGQKSAAGVKLTVVTTLPQLQDRDEAKSMRFGGRNGSYGRFSGGRGGRGGYSDRRNDQFSRGRGGGGGRGRGNTSRKW